MKKFIIYYFVFIITIIVIYIGSANIIDYIKYQTKEVEIISKIEDKTFKIKQDSEWKEVTIKGVNLGLGQPENYPGEYAIDKETYKRWFKQIQEMNANTIRVYTLQSPEFYNALYEYNKKNNNPLYVVHGIWVDENLIEKYNDAFENNAIFDYVETESKNIINAIHGNANIKKRAGKTGGIYNKDISKYVIGWIAGIEFESDFIANTNLKNLEITSYDGKYFSIENGKAFDVFITKMEDYITTYEMKKYKCQRPIAISNWLTTDPLSHPNEPNSQMEDSETIDIEKIRVKNYDAGIFASYHVYPYYPDFLNYDTKYTQKNSSGEIDTYKAYLEELTKYHSVPVLISEVGLPTSRGICHSAIYSKYNQGGLTEEEQGIYLATLIDDIVDTDNTLGFIIFSWQDEWFKRSWNTVDFDNENSRANWMNVQTAEENFGILAFDEEKNIYPDESIEEWNKEDIQIKNEKYELSIQENKSYLYLLIKTNKDFDFDKDELIIPIDTLENSGNNEYKKIKFDKNVEFLLKINGKYNTKIYVDSYYDAFYYLYGYKNTILERNRDYEQRNNNIFNSANLMVNRKLYLPETNENKKVEINETGKLKYGISNPESENYNSLADFYYNNGYIEIRIPWALLNFMDPTTNEIIDDLYINNDITGKIIKSINIGIGNKEDSLINLTEYKLKDKNNHNYQERLKKSYYILKAKLNEIE